MTITMDMFSKGTQDTPRYIIPSCKECTMHTQGSTHTTHTNRKVVPMYSPITHPMLRAISTIRGTQPTLMSLIHEEHDLHTTMHYAHHIIPSTMEEMAQQYPPMYTHTKEAVPMHYTLTLTPTTTRRWMGLFTMCTLMLMAVQAHTHTPTWGGVHTLLTLGAYMGAALTMGASVLCWYTRTHQDITLSTHYLDTCTHCQGHHMYSPFVCEYGVTQAEYWL